MRWLMEFKMMHFVRVTPNIAPIYVHQDCTDYQMGEELDTIKEVPENGTETSTKEISSIDTQPDLLESCPGSSTPIQHEGGTFSSGCNIESSPSPSQSKTDHEDALSADEGIQTSPPFETDDPWDHDSDAHEITTTPNKRRYSMSAVTPRSARSTQEVDGEIGVKLRSPTKSWLAEEVKARRWRYRPKSCSLPHMDWLKQRTDTALDRSAEMQRRTAELIRSAKSVREQDV
ncbi:uncharacterized protein LOC119743118 [Patiria miniata]|uniref:Uncharacterized protein n=1 Tax=Patiria miniata TaxID=46514 RepID=A0A914BIZ2_PATMI|nr:uncharacterized protein LOC119743118 [Patiria miniata]